jgi:hypothetical protein
MFTIRQRVELHWCNDVKHFRIQKLMGQVVAPVLSRVLKVAEGLASGPEDVEGGTTSGQVRTGRSWEIAQ